MRKVFLLLIVNLLCLLGQAQTPNGKVLLYLPFNNSIEDESPQQLEIVNNGAILATDRFGNANSALKFNGKNQFLTLADTSKLHPLSFTISGWFCFDSIVPQSATFIDKNIRNTVNDAINLSFNNGILSGHISDNNGNGALSGVQFTPEADTWFHAAFVYDNFKKLQQFYFNGLLTDSVTELKWIGYDKHPFLFGADRENERDTLFFKGRMDDIKIINKVFTSSEINALASEKDSVYAVQRGSSVFICQTNSCDYVMENTTSPYCLDHLSILFYSIIMMK